MVSRHMSIISRKLSRAFLPLLSYQRRIWEKTLTGEESAQLLERCDGWLLRRHDANRGAWAVPCSWMIDGSSRTLGQLSVQTARFLPRDWLRSATSVLCSPREQNMAGFNHPRTQIDTMKLPSASAPPHLRRDMILLSATFIEMKPHSFLSPARAEGRRGQLLFDIT
jgi:hypothetical protein